MGEGGGVEPPDRRLLSHHRDSSVSAKQKRAEGIFRLGAAMRSKSTEVVSDSLRGEEGGKHRVAALIQEKKGARTFRRVVS